MQRVTKFDYLPYCQAQSPNQKSQILKSKDLDFGWHLKIQIGQIQDNLEKILKNIVISYMKIYLSE